MRIQGKREVAEAVLTAFLCAVATGLAELAVEELKKRAEAKKEGDEHAANTEGTRG